MNKEVALPIYCGILLSHNRKEFEPVLVKWMKLEPLIQSEEVRKRKTNVVY